jgi:hypothetical protein
MKTRQIVLVALLATALLVGAAAAAAAVNSGYTLDWFTVDGGGGTSNGGSYALSGSSGQPEAGTLTGGGYTLRGGFWGAAPAGNQLYLPLVRR